MIIMIVIIFSYIMRITCVFNMTVILTQSSDDYRRWLLPDVFSDLFASDKMYKRREASACPISLISKQDSRWYHFNACGMTRPGIQSVTSPS